MSWYKPWTWADDSESQKDQRGQLIGEGDAASMFANQAHNGFSQLGEQAGAERDYLRQLAMGQNSVSAEQLRQGLQQNLAAQRSLAAGAAPQNAAMAARTAAIQSGRLGSGLAGQQAVAGLQERNMAHENLRNLIMQQRQQELQASLGGRQTAVQGYSSGQAGAPDKSWIEKYGPALVGLGTVAFSDKRLKKNVKRADREADSAINKLRAYTFAYKNQEHGKGKHVGVMAQDLEGAGLGHAVIDTPTGKAVHGAHLATSNTALIARLGQRVAKLEGKGK